MITTTRTRIKSLLIGQKIVNCHENGVFIDFTKQKSGFETLLPNSASSNLHNHRTGAKKFCHAGNEVKGSE